MNQRGGLDVYVREAKIRSQMLWDMLDSSNSYYVIKIEKAYRSCLNVVFRIENTTISTLKSQKRQRQWWQESPPIIIGIKSCRYGNFFVLALTAGGEAISKTGRTESCAVPGST